MAGAPMRCARAVAVAGTQGLHQHRHDGAERWHAAPSPASRSPAALVELASGPGSSSSWSWSPSPNEARPQLLGDDLDGGPGVALLSGLAPLLQPEQSRPCHM